MTRTAGRRWKRWAHRQKRMADRLAALQRRVDAASRDNTPATRAVMQRAGDQWYRLAGRVSLWGRLRYVFVTDGAGELARGRVAWPYPPVYGPSDRRRPWRYVSRRHYDALDTSAQTTDGADYVGEMPEGRGYRLRFPTRRHAALAHYRCRFGLPPVVPTVPAHRGAAWTG